MKKKNTFKSAMKLLDSKVIIKCFIKYYSFVSI